MSGEIPTTKKPYLLDGLGTNLAFSGIMSGGFGSITAIKNHGGIKGAIKATKENNAALRAFKDKIAPTNDKFTTNLKTAYNYQEYTRLAKQKAKLEKKIARCGDKLPFFEKVKNIFRKTEDNLDVAKYKSNMQSIIDDIDIKKSTLEAGENISSDVTKFLSSASDIKSATKGLFKAELKDPFGLFFAGTEVVTRFTQQAIPAFKNEGFIAGLKETAKALGAGVATWFTDAGFSVALRNIGATVGAFAGPVGSAIGSFVGNIIGGFLSNKLIQTIFPMKEQAEVPQEDVQETNIEAQKVSTQTQEASSSSNETQATSQDIMTKYANMPSREEVKQAAYAQAFQGKAGRLNRYYA